MAIAVDVTRESNAAATVSAVVEARSQPKASQPVLKCQVTAIHIAQVKETIEILAAFGILVILSVTFAIGPAPLLMTSLAAAVAAIVFLSWPNRPHDTVVRTVGDHLSILCAPVLCELALIGFNWAASVDLWPALVPRLLLWLTLTWSHSYKHLVEALIVLHVCSLVLFVLAVVHSALSDTAHFIETLPELCQTYISHSVTIWLEAMFLAVNYLVWLTQPIDDFVVQ